MVQLLRLYATVVAGMADLYMWTMLREVDSSEDRIFDEVFVAAERLMEEYLPGNMGIPRTWASKSNIPVNVDCFGIRSYNFV